MRKAFELLDEDDSTMLDTMELNAAFDALGLDKRKREVKRILKRVDRGGDRQFSLYEFHLLVKDLRLAVRAIDATHTARTRVGGGPSFCCCCCCCCS